MGRGRIGLLGAERSPWGSDDSVSGGTQAAKRPAGLPTTPYPAVSARFRNSAYNRLATSMKNYPLSMGHFKMLAKPSSNPSRNRISSVKGPWTVRLRVLGSRGMCSDSGAGFLRKISAQNFRAGPGYPRKELQKSSTSRRAAVKHGSRNQRTYPPRREASKPVWPD